MSSWDCVCVLLIKVVFKHNEWCEVLVLPSTTASVKGIPVPWRPAPVRLPRRPFLTTTYLCRPTCAPRPRCSAWPPRRLQGGRVRTAFALASQAEVTAAACSWCSALTVRPESWSWSSRCEVRWSSAWRWRCPNTPTAPSKPNIWPGSTFWFHPTSSEEEIECWCLDLKRKECFSAKAESMIELFSDVARFWSRNSTEM